MTSGEEKLRTEVRKIKFISNHPCHLQYTFFSLQFSFIVHPCVLIKLLTCFDFPYKLIRSGIPFYGHCLLQRFKTDGFVCPEVKFMIYFSKIYPSNTDNCVLSDKQPYMVFFLFFPLKVLF